MRHILLFVLLTSPVIVAMGDCDNCPPGALDSDGDQLCDHAEIEFHETDPFNADTDGDSLNDFDEIVEHETDPNNVDTDGDLFSDGAEASGYHSTLGADPLRQDVFLEIDYVPGQAPRQASIDLVVAAFADAPVSNPDGSTGITLHVNVDDQVPAPPATILFERIGQTFVSPDFDAIKDANFAAADHPIFHYALYIDACAVSGIPLALTGSALSLAVPASDLVYCGPTADSEHVEALKLMHELGHNFGLQHNGAAEMGDNPQYLSIMNFQYYAASGLRVDEVDGILDYSRLQIAATDEAALVEADGFAPAAGTPTTEADLAAYGMKTDPNAWVAGKIGGPIDFNGDGDTSTPGVGHDINQDGSFDVLPATQNDWDHLQLQGGSGGASGYPLGDVGP